MTNLESAPMLLHIPHSATRIPTVFASTFPNRDLLHSELLCMTDHYTEDLFDAPCGRLVFPVSRLVCDVERFRAPADEAMTAAGMWVCYTRSSTGTVLACHDERHVQTVLHRLYDPHHARLTAMTARRLAVHGGALVVDCHSFPSVPLPYEPSQEPDRPDFCLGTDAFHTAPQLADAAESYLRGAGYTVARNTPFAGTIVPLAYLGREARVHSIMVEVNRALYLNERTGAPGPGYARTHAILRGLLDTLAAQESQLLAQPHCGHAW